MTTKTDLRELTKAELIELLTTDIAGWNRLYREARRASDYLWSADLRSANLSSADLSSANLSSADLRSANLSSANLWSANLSSANLSSADLRSANLSSANLWSANLSSADLSSADLSSANLWSANLSSADLSSADLRSANLWSANLDWRSPLWPFRWDIFDILDAAPNEVAALREQIVAGNIDGSLYEGACACLCGTIANAQGCNYDAIPGVTPDGGRPAELWFYPIRKGDVPMPELLDAESPEWPSEGVYRATVALRWVDEWVAKR